MPPFFKQIFSLLLTLYLCSCGIINNIGYKSLTAAQKQALVPLNDYQMLADTTSFRLVRTDGDRLKALMKEEEYTWVHYWIPYCKSPVCRPLGYYERLSQGTAKKLRLVVVSQVYDYADVKNKVEIDGYSKPILVPDIALYGKDMYRARKHFTTDLTGDKILSKHMPAHMLFRHDSLIYAGVDMTAPILDSVLRQ